MAKKSQQCVGVGIGDRCRQLKILKYKIAISMKDFQVTANCPKGRLFEIDSQKQWNAAIAKVLTKERELIGRLPDRAEKRLRMSLIRAGKPGNI